VATTNPAGIASVNPTSVSEELPLGLDNLKESEAEPFNARLDAANDFEIVGGSIVGGAEDPPDEPPPHAERREPRIITVQHHARDVRVGNVRFAPGHHTEGRLLRAAGVNHRNNDGDSTFPTQGHHPTKVGLRQDHTSKE
jgi:hypothetical protein